MRGAFLPALAAAIFLAAGSAGCSVVVDVPGASTNDAGDGGDGGTGTDAATAEGGAPAPIVTDLVVLPGILQPAFSPLIHDYTVACDAGANAWSIAATVPQGARLSVQGAETKALGVDLVVNENEAVVVRVDTASASSEYWIRCLPHDFPDVFVEKPGAPSAGYYLVGSAVATVGYAPYAMVLDANGTPVWYHHGTQGLGALNVDSPAPNVISWMNGQGPFGHDPTAAHDVYGLDPWMLTQVKASGTATDGHELVALPNGHHYVLSYPPRPGFDLTGLGTLGANETIADCEIQELDETGALVWNWSASDHIDPVKEPTDYYTANVNGVLWRDVYHCNSIEVDPSGDLLVSARHLDAVFLIDRVTGKLRWKLGGIPWNKEGAEILSYVNETETGFFHQHDARFLPDGHLTVFDDHSSQFGVARCVEYALDADSATATLVWEVRDTQVSSAMGGCRRQPDGNTVVAWGWPANNYGHVLTEFDHEGNALFDVAFGKGNLSYRAIKVPLSQFTIGTLRTTAGLP